MNSISLTRSTRATAFPSMSPTTSSNLSRHPERAASRSYFSLNLFVEKRFHAFGRYWALRGGFENTTDHANPTVVNADINSPHFLTFGAFQGRAFTTRIRLLGKK